MRVLVSGATGTIGRAVTAALQARGDDVVAVTRDVERARTILGDVEAYAWTSPARQSPPAAALHGADAVIHLLGEPIGQRWTAAVKRELRDSRLRSTRLLARAIQARGAHASPLTLVSQSATGYYGTHGDEWQTEDSPPGTDFLARLVVDWERESLAAVASNVRVVVTRTGVVLSPRGGALEKMAPPFRLGIGGPIAGGRQYVPWIHIDDAAGALLHCLDTVAASGPVNVVSPNPATNAELSQALGDALHRPAVLPVPGFAVRALFGEMAVTVTGGQRVSAAKLERLGYVFAHPRLDTALRDVLDVAA